MSAFWKDLFREIKNTLGRFVSLVIITALGAASVVGIQATSIDMRSIADKTYKEHSLYDLQVKSVMGFDQDDAAAMTAAAGVAAVMPTYIYDVFVGIGNEKRAVRTYALPDGINTLEVIEGRLPENPGECVTEQDLLTEGGWKIGDRMALGLDDMSDYYKVLENDSFTIVGVVDSPLYISFGRGNTTLGDGSLDYYLYLHPDAYQLEVYTDLYLLMDGSASLDHLSEDYSAAANEWEQRVQQTAELRVQLQHDELADAQREVDDGWAEYYDGLAALETELEDARQELAEAAIKLEDARAELIEGQEALDKEIADGYAEIEKKEKDLIDGQRELNKNRDKLQEGQAQLDEAREKLEQTLAELIRQAPRGVSPELDLYYDQVYAGLQQLEQQQAELDEGLTAITKAQAELDNGAQRLTGARAELEAERLRAQAEIDDGWAEYTKGLEEYQDGLLTLEAEEADARAELADAKRELEEAQEVLNGAPEPEWFIFTRQDGIAFDSYYQDTLRLEKLGYIFPMVFFLVAVMVSLTTMSRMVEDHRTQIGVYKALGYRPAAILMKYLLYAFTASACGGIGGAILGSRLFPIIISDAYGHLYNMPAVETPLPMGIALAAVAAAVAAVVLVTLGTYLGSMRGHPALLMRPKPPAKGKRVLLERVTFLWRHLGFFSKVTARNTFRYKKRFFMTLAGVAGCSALLLTAFGLSDSITGVAELQYESIIQYDARVYLKDVTTLRQREAIDELLPAGHLYVREESVTASGGEGALSASLIIPETAQGLNDYYNLYAADTGEPVVMAERGVLVTDKLARVMGVEAGESFTITLNDGREYTAVVAGIADNYILHAIYMSPELYTEIFGGECFPNSALMFYDNDRELASDLPGNENVRALLHIGQMKEQIKDSTDAMGVVTAVLIVLACALALVVLFNLTNINISERIRELATIKVLGFNDAELAMYIYRENGVVTLLGILLGLVGGLFLHGYVLTSVEIDVLKFPQIIQPQSYLYAVALSLFFAVFVNLVMSRKLARIDMVESLKNVE